MFPRLHLLTFVLLPVAPLCAQSGTTPVGDFGEAPHHYWTEPDDPFTQFTKRVESGAIKLNAASGEKEFVAELLEGLRAGGRLHDCEPLVLQQEAEEQPDITVVFDNEDSSAHPSIFGDRHQVRRFTRTPPPRESRVRVRPAR